MVPSAFFAKFGELEVIVSECRESAELKHTASIFPAAGVAVTTTKTLSLDGDITLTILCSPLGKIGIGKDIWSFISVISQCVIRLGPVFLTADILSNLYLYRICAPIRLTG